MDPLPRCAVLFLIGAAAWVGTSSPAAEPMTAKPNLTGPSTTPAMPAGSTLSAPAVPAAPRPKSAPAAAAGEALFLNESVDVRTATGVVGLAPGTPVRLLRTNGKTGRLTVTDEHLQAEVAPTQVTRDAVAAAGLRQQEEASQHAARAALAANQAAQAKVQQQALEARQRYQARIHQEDMERELSHPNPFRGGVGFTGVYDRPYGLRGNPYSAAHEAIPRLNKNGPKPLNPLDEGRNSLGFY